jgi:hypothetical protein
MHVTIVPSFLSVWKTAKLWMWKEFNTLPVLFEDTKPKN